MGNRGANGALCRLVVGRGTAAGATKNRNFTRGCFWRRHGRGAGRQRIGGLENRRICCRLERPLRRSGSFGPQKLYGICPFGRCLGCFLPPKHSFRRPQVALGGGGRWHSGGFGLGAAAHPKHLVGCRSWFGGLGGYLVDSFEANGTSPGSAYGDFCPVAGSGLGPTQNPEDPPGSAKFAYPGGLLGPQSANAPSASVDRRRRGSMGDSFSRIRFERHGPVGCGRNHRRNPPPQRLFVGGQRMGVAGIGPVGIGLGHGPVGLMEISKRHRKSLFGSGFGGGLCV